VACASRACPPVTVSKESSEAAAKSVFRFMGISPLIRHPLYVWLCTKRCNPVSCSVYGFTWKPWTTAGAAA
jgi:hypothetical protein